MQQNDSAARIYNGLTWEIAGQMIEQEFLVRRVDFEIDVVVAWDSERFSGTERLIPFGPSPRMNQAKEERSYEEYMAR